MKGRHPGFASGIQIFDSSWLPILVQTGGLRERSDSVVKQAAVVSKLLA